MSRIPKMSFPYVLGSLVLLLLSCSRTPATPVDVTRLDRILADYSSYSESRQMDVIDSLRPEIDAMFAVLGDNYVTSGTLDRWSRGDVVRVFQPVVDSVFPDIRNLEQCIGDILARAQRDSLQLPSLRFATVTWGNPRPVVRVDSVMLIALNHFLGADYPGYEQWQDYRRMEKTPEQLPYAVATALVATQYPMTATDAPTLLSWMLYEGALVEARMRLVPDAKPYLALGFTPDQLKFADSNCRKIWEEMALRRLIYDTDPMTIDRYIAPAPMTPLLQSQTPGRIGRYIGWRIIRSYLDNHPATSLATLITPAFYNSPQTLIASGF